MTGGIIGSLVGGFNEINGTVDELSGGECVAKMIVFMSARDEREMTGRDERRAGRSSR